MGKKSKNKLSAHRKPGTVCMPQQPHLALKTSKLQEISEDCKEATTQALLEKSLKTWEEELPCFKGVMETLKS